MVDHSFDYAVDRRFLPFLVPFGFRASRDRVMVSDAGRLGVTFGFLSLQTPLYNVEGAHITRGYRWWTAIGARLSRVDDGLTFGTNPKAGVCIHFRKKVSSALRRSGHSALTVTVRDLDGLVQMLGRTEQT
jgi:hypothetical protein